jgi:hypothetical protein
LQILANFKSKNKFFPCLTMSNTYRTSLGKLTICYGWPYNYIGIFNVMCIQINGKSSISKIDYCNNIKWFLSFNMFVCMMPLSTIFQLYRGGQFYWWRKPEYPEKTTDLSQVTDKLYHIMLYTLPWSKFELKTSVVIVAVCIGSC